MSEKKALNISARSFLIALCVIFAVMLVAYVLSLTVPGGAYERAVDPVTGQETIIEDSFHDAEGGLPFWRWLASPFLLLGAEGSGTVIAILVFLLVIGGVFECLGTGGLLEYMLDRIIAFSAGARYKLMALMILFFMLLGSLIGSFEECVPMVPIVAALAVRLGWDAMTGLLMSVMAAGCGFAAGVFNPFTVGLAQNIAGLPMFSGAPYRAVGFVLIYALLFTFTFLHAKRIERPVEASGKAAGQTDPKKSRAVACFAIILGIGLVLVLCSPFLTFLQDLTMIIVAVMFLVAGVTASLVCGLRGKKFFGSFLRGMTGMLPAVLMVLMASSVKYTLEEAHVMDTILHGAVTLAGGLPKWAVLVFIYLIVLVMNMFIASGSAKACMLIPLIMPLASLYGIPAQLCIMAFAFGDGFSNVFYPTNPVLLISLGLVDVGYGAWFRRTWRFQLENFLLTTALLLVGLAVIG